MISITIISVANNRMINRVSLLFDMILLEIQVPSDQKFFKVNSQLIFLSIIFYVLSRFLN